MLDISCTYSGVNVIPIAMKSLAHSDQGGTSCIFPRIYHCNVWFVCCSYVSFAISEISTCYDHYA